MTATLIQRRRGTRIRAQIPLRLTSLDPSCTFSENCHTLLVNPHGCGVRLNRPLKPGLRLRVDGLPGGGSATARVTTNTHPRPGSRYWTVGLGFDAPGNVWCLAPVPPDWTSCASLPRSSRGASTLTRQFEDNQERNHDQQPRKPGRSNLSTA